MSISLTSPDPADGPLHPGLTLTAARAGMWHAGQVDKAGRPYVEHLAGVAAHLERHFPGATTSEFHAAWLHDVLEDTEVTAGELRRLGYAERIVAIVEAVTKPPPPRPSYAEWIARIAAEAPLAALRVKLSDLAHNGDPCRLAALDPAEAERLGRRYAEATRVLRAALKERMGRAPEPEPDDRVAVTLKLDPMDYWTLREAAGIADRSPEAFIEEEMLDLAQRILATGTLRHVTLARDRAAEDRPVLDAFRASTRTTGPLDRFRPPQTAEREGDGGNES